MAECYANKPHRGLLRRVALSVLLACGAAPAGTPTEPAKLLESGRYREALASLEKGASDPASRLLRGRAYLGLGRYAEAEADLTEPGPAQGEPVRLEALSRAVEVRGDVDKALTLMTQAVEAKRKSLASTESIDGANALAYYRTAFGELAFRTGKLDVAKEQFQKAISLVGEAHAKLHALDIPHDERDPRLFAGPATAGLARVYGAQGDAQRAERSWRSVNARTDDPAILASLVTFYRARNDAKTSRRHLERALKLSKGKLAQRRVRALLLAEDKATQKEALELAEALHAESPNLEACDALAWVLHLQGDQERAAEILKPLVDLGTRDPEVLYHAGLIAQARKQTEDARRLLKGSLALNPAFDPVMSPDAKKRLEQLRRGAPSTNPPSAH